MATKHVLLGIWLVVIVDCISDLHGFFPTLPGGDLLIVAGDLTGRDSQKDYDHFFLWLSDQQYKKKIWIAGNHDGLIEKRKLDITFTFTDPRTLYLCDSGFEFEGLKIWGSPWTPTFYNWHFMKDRGADIREKWNLIPRDTDILVTHGPPWGVLDNTNPQNPIDKDSYVGCEELRHTLERIQPRLHVFGHVHESYGQMILKCTPRDVICVNASIMDGDYNPVNKPIRVIL